jgi:hypothetical protein
MPVGAYPTSAVAGAKLLLHEIIQRAFIQTNV